MFEFCLTCGHEREEHDDRGCFAADDNGVDECPCTEFVA